MYVHESSVGYTLYIQNNTYANQVLEEREAEVSGTIIDKPYDSSLHDYLEKVIASIPELKEYEANEAAFEEEKEKSDISEILKLFPEKVLSMKTFETFIKNAVEKKGFDYVKGTAEYTVLKKPKSYKSYLSKALEENWADEHIANKKSRIKQQQKNETINFVEIEEAKPKIVP